MGGAKLNEAVGARLRELRKAAGWTQQEHATKAAAVSRSLGLPEWTYQTWAKCERGELPITMTHVEVAAAVLGVTPADIVDDGRPVAAPSGAAGLSADALAVARILDTQGRKAAISYILAGLR